MMGSYLTPDHSTAVHLTADHRQTTASRLIFRHSTAVHLTADHLTAPLMKKASDGLKTAYFR